jgi:exopolysaccharide biosynthesis polyprenyl glycosylphosphotransferase
VISRSGIARIAVMSIHACVVALSLLVMARLRFGETWIHVWNGIIESPVLTAGFYVVFALGIFTLSGLYRPDERWSVRKVIADVTGAVSLLALATMGMLFFFNLDDVSRLYVVFVLVAIWLGMVLSTIGLRKAYEWARTAGYATRHVVVVGAGIEVAQFVRKLTIEHPELGIQIEGFLGDPDSILADYERLGTVDDLPSVLADNIVDEVIVCLPMEQWHDIDTVVRYSEQQGKAVRVPLPAMDYTVARSRFDQIGDAPVLSMVMGPDEAFGLAVKRSIDLILSLVGLILLAPVLIVVALAILINDGRPIFFVQKRVGLHGRPFNLVKFRTMVNGAEQQKHALMKHNERIGPVFKMSADPRVTRLGSFLRTTSIDELPQLWNVVRGRMSLVGPRPPTLEEVRAYDPRHRRRLSMKPGLTGLWQVSARDDPSFERWVQLDLEYIDNWSLAYDISLLARTPMALIRRPGR